VLAKNKEIRAPQSGKFPATATRSFGHSAATAGAAVR
jgi:hypothetical protein